MTLEALNIFEYHTRDSIKILHYTITFMTNQGGPLVFPVTSCDPHRCLFKGFVLTLKMVGCVRECISIKETTKVAPDQFNYVDGKTAVNYVKDRSTS